MSASKAPGSPIRVPRSGQAATRAPTHERTAPAAARAVALWLLVCAAFVVLVLMVGGMTRLLHAGLSIVQWQPLTGTLPPLDDAQWRAAFEQYQGTPEFRLLYPDMTLAQFRHIFWWEYAHRLFARLSGAVFLLPYLWFLARGQLPRWLALRLAGLLALGGAQGAVGWLMVASGLVDEPHVSPLRLCAHLGLALLLLALLVYHGGAIWIDGLRRSTARPAAAWLALPGIVWCMALSGALMAGTRSGYAYDTFPTMNGELLPSGLLRLSPWYHNLLDNPTTVQFLHRALACVVLGTVLLYAWKWMRLTNAPSATNQAGPAARRRRLLALAFMLTALAAQLALGAATVMSGVAIPLAAAHQAGAVVLFVAALWAGLLFRAQDGRAMQEEA